MGYDCPNLMQTLGLDGAPPPQPWYKLWAWPDVKEPEEAIGAARNGAIAAVAFGLLTSILGTMTNGPGALLGGSFYLLAAVGIRQLSFPASAMPWFSIWRARWWSFDLAGCQG